MDMSSTRDVQNHAEKTLGPDASVCIMYSGIFGSLPERTCQC